MEAASSGGTRSEGSLSEKTDRDLEKFVQLTLFG